MSKFTVDIWPMGESPLESTFEGAAAYEAAERAVEKGDEENRREGQPLEDSVFVRVFSHKQGTFYEYRVRCEQTLAYESEVI